MTIYLVFFATLWLFIFLFHPKARRAMLWNGFFSAPVLVLFLITNYSLIISTAFLALIIKTFILGFLIGGVVASVYELFLHTRLVAIPHPHKEKMVWLVVGPIVFVILAFFGFSLFWTITISLLAEVSVLIVLRHDLFWDAVLSGLTLAVIYFLIALFTWRFLPVELPVGLFGVENISGVTLASLPIEELVCAFFFGFLFGPLYEGVKSYRLKKC